MFPASQLFDQSGTEDWAIFASDAPVWEAVGQIADFLFAKLDSVNGPLIRGEVDERAVIGEQVFLSEGATVEANATIQGPAWIGEGTVVRAGAYLRENVIVGKGCTLGNSSEFKNCLLFDECEVPHFNYVGDSILG
ncbi:MAG: UDP-N-acetylglucosamine diphosphorylase, partial [Verrucomicrobiota bacterium]